MSKKKKGHHKSASAQVPQKVGQFTVMTTLHGYAMEGPFTPGPKDVWYCDHKECKYTQHGLYRRYNIENWRSAKFGKKFVLCDGCVRTYTKPDTQPQFPHHQHQPSAPNVNVTLNMPQNAPSPYYAQPYPQPMTIIQPMAQPMSISQHTQSSSLGSPLQYQDYGQQQSSYIQQAPQQVAFSNAQVSGTQYVAAADQKTDEGMGYTGPVSQYSSDGTAMGSGAESKAQEQSTYNGVIMGHGIHIVQQGWMMKQGGLVKSWKRRYFVLKTNKVLNYYESDNSSMVKGSIELSKVIGVEKKQKKSLELVTPKRTWPFACVSTEVRDQWVANISRVAGLE